MRKGWGLKFVVEIMHKIRYTYFIYYFVRITKGAQTVTVKECYDCIGGNYEEAKNRLLDDKRITKFLRMFTLDKSMQAITEALEKKDYAEAFNGAHSLKGVSQNMAFSRLSMEVEALTEDLRGGSPSENVMNLYQETYTDYQLVMQTIKEFLDSQV